MVLLWNGIAILVVLVRLAIELLGEIVDPVADCLPCLVKALLNVLANFREVI